MRHNKPLLRQAARDTVSRGDRALMLTAGVA